ncbi:hypothetical protein HYT01_01970 [Candidatus Giovannonibacteria bacterium]|nr:hypothetical protein [Candidatus Giovannonibacteria bacterium]
MLKMFRCAKGYNLVILVDEAAGPGGNEEKFYRYSVRQIGEEKPERFHEINQETAFEYLNGKSDDLGYEIPTHEIFPSLGVALLYIESKQTKQCVDRIKKLGIDPDNEE